MVVTEQFFCSAFCRQSHWPVVETGKLTYEGSTVAPLAVLIPIISSTLIQILKRNIALKVPSKNQAVEFGNSKSLLQSIPIRD